MRSDIVAYCEDVLDPELRALRAERDRLAQLYAIRRSRIARREQEQSRAADMDLAFYQWVRRETALAHAYGREQGAAHRRAGERGMKERPPAREPDVAFAEELCRTPGIARTVWHAWAVRASLWQTSVSLRLDRRAHFALFDDVSAWIRQQRWERRER